MPKHKSEKVTLGEIIGAMDDETLTEWWNAIGVELADYNPQAADLKEFIAKEMSYLEEHREDLYLVSWPDHVINPRFNSDASYQLIQDEVNAESTDYDECTYEVQDAQRQVLARTGSEDDAILHAQSIAYSRVVMFIKSGTHKSATVIYPERGDTYSN